MFDNLRPIRFDFEKQYLLDMHDWTKKLNNSDILINTFDRSKSDVKLRSYIDVGLNKIIEITALVKSGKLCGHSSTLTDSYLPWITNEDGRIWSASDLQIYRNELKSEFKLKTLLETHIDTVKHLILYRKSVLDEFKTYDVMFPKRFKKNLFKQGMRINEKVREYQNILQTEITIRKLLLSTLAFREKELNRKHKTFLKDLIQLLNKVTTHLCFDKSERKLNGDKYNGRYLIPRCSQCHRKRKWEQGDLIDLSDDGEDGVEIHGMTFF